MLYRDTSMGSRKTPVALLQEASVKEKITPEFNLIRDESGSDNPTFTYELIMDEYRAEGDGSSKKTAKQAAAYRMLQLLQLDSRFAAYNIDRFLNDVDKSYQRPVIAEPVAKVNAVGHLNDLCIIHGFPLAKYSCTREEGPPHHKFFTMACSCCDVTKEAIANTKKQAKQAVAADMCNWLDGIIEYEAARQRNVEVTDSSQVVELCNRYPRKKANLSTRLDTLKNTLRIPSPTLKKYLECIHDDNFFKNVDESVLDIFRLVVDEMECNYFIKNMGIVREHFVVTVTIQTVPELTGIGIKTELDKGIDAAVQNIIKSMCICYDPRLNDEIIP